jgi:glutathione synthase/RimK-type ligase-like ATP-grasp enzyme
MRNIIVLSTREGWDYNLDEIEIITANEYLSQPEYAAVKNARIFNFSDQYDYQSQGYYVSLIAEARGHKPFPDIKTLLDLNTSKIVESSTVDLDDLIQKTLKTIDQHEFTMNIYFGKNGGVQYAKLAFELFRIFRSPFLRAKFRYSNKWQIENINAIALKDIPDAHKGRIEQYAGDFFRRKYMGVPRSEKQGYKVAVLYSDEKEAPPSNRKAIGKLIEAAGKTGLRAEILTKRDFNKLHLFDALFIRDNTSVDNHTYKFARYAQAEGIAVVDYPETISKCCNKVYIAELLNLAKIPTPKTMIIHSPNRNEVVNSLGLPCVLKSPDSTFSLGVVKVDTVAELNAQISRMLKKSDMILGQQYMYTEYDWRIGILDNRILFACKYFMAEGHWQIYNWKASSSDNITGCFECIPVESVPKNIRDIALKSVALVHPSGLFGIDIKEVNGKPFVIEINDNPNMDAGIEDKILKDEIYLAVMQSLRKRIEAKHLNGRKPSLQTV